MIEFGRLVGFEWDDGNASKNILKHGVSSAEAEQVFFNDPVLVVEDLRHSETENRWHALGRTDKGRLLHVTFTVREAATRIRVISARDMHRKERARYGEEI